MSDRSHEIGTVKLASQPYSLIVNTIYYSLHYPSISNQFNLEVANIEANDNNLERQSFRYDGTILHLGEAYSVTS
jgi:hypothetical protein